MDGDRFWDPFLGIWECFMAHGVPAELQMGCNGRNGRGNGWEPWLLGLLLFTDPSVVLLLMFNTSTVFSP